MSTPRISLNKLGEYLQASPQRRKKIVKDAKDPKPFIVTRYKDARQAIKDYFVNDYDTEILIKSIDNHEEKEINSEFQEQDQALSIEVLETIMDVDLPDFSEFNLSFNDLENNKMVISGIDVSINPDLIIRGNYKGKKVVGAVKLHISKSNQLDKEGASNVATLLKEYVETHIAKKDEKVLLHLCVSVDVFGRTFSIAPKSFKRRMLQISSACEEIALWWEQL